MTVSVSNTNLVDSFNTWRLNTNLLATTMSNNVVTVSRAGSANRGGAAKGNGHVSGTFSATNLRTSTLRAGNTTSTLSLLTISSNVSVNTATVQIYANTTFHGNVVFNTVGTDRIDFGDISRWRLTGGSNGQYPKYTGGDRIDFVPLTLRQVQDLSSNSAHLILSAANTSFAEETNSPHLIFAGGNSNGDKIDLYLNGDATAGDSDLTIQLADNVGDSVVRVANRANTTMASISSRGIFTANSYTTNGGETLATSGEAIALAIALG